ncbi:MAG: hypothetical protein GY802_01335 [Gammaproteobacteria bacterium]|nr:hypothetical protein [Gammaproteobacteria bacterium]MCP4386911.1 hypothetical protein [Gammaproteobacteria bacterium]
MNSKPVLGDWEVPRIQKMRSNELRRIAELPIPGKAGSLLQDLNSAPAAIEIHGSVYADERSEFLTSVREKFNAGEPVTFVADITEATDIQYVMIESLVVEESSLRPEQIDYALKLRESPPPPPPADLLGDIDDGLLGLAEDFVDGVTDVMDAIDALANIPDFSDPSELLGGTLDDATGALDQLQDVGGLINDLFGSD